MTPYTAFAAPVSITKPSTITSLSSQTNNNSCSLSPRSSSSPSSSLRMQQPSNDTSASTASNVNRRAFLFTALSSTVLSATAAMAAAKTSLSGDYAQDAAMVLADMRAACDLARGTPGMADTVAQTRREMNDFVALYRRNEKVAGSTSFSTLYTAINTLSGHYASYGNAYPVPEKRKKRLTQQFTDIDRAINRGR